MVVKLIIGAFVVLFSLVIYGGLFVSSDESRMEELLENEQL